MTRRKLKGKIIEVYGSIAAFCKENEISEPTARNILRGKRRPKKLERIGWCTVLGVNPDEAEIFFVDEVGKV